MTLQERCDPRTAVRNAVLLLYPQERSTVTEIMALTGQSLPAVLRHLSALEAGGECFRDLGLWRVGTRPMERPADLALSPPQPSRTPTLFDI